jgi:hypothetical protein
MIDREKLKLKFKVTTKSVERRQLFGDAAQYCNRE